ncbi:Plasmodium vivax Vir protein, putative [Plasmodium vivax]|uniref:Vir protein, putative n=1 Tax=Plasmodium vivax TaxID=5855 RepID=A0A1G4E5I7_PLAVI|nr:Plasmodium vivax Vir protein, putative [Plasmodium vivax]
MAPLNEESYYESATSFHKYNAYYDKNTTNHTKNNVKECNIIKSTFYQDQDGIKFIIPCLKIASFIKHLQENDVTHENYEYCPFLSYIINSEIIKIKNSDYENQEFYTKLINAYESNGFSLKNICEHTSDYIGKDIVDQIRKIANIYSKFHGFLSTNDLSMNCNKFNECVQLYKDYMQSCDGHKNTSFCNALKQFRIYSSSQIPVTLNCPNERRLLLSSTSKEYSGDGDGLSISDEPPDTDETDLESGSTLYSNWILDTS